MAGAGGQEHKQLIKDVAWGLYYSGITTNITLNICRQETLMPHLVGERDSLTVGSKMPDIVVMEKLRIKHTCKNISDLRGYVILRLLTRIPLSTKNLATINKRQFTNLLDFSDDFMMQQYRQYLSEYITPLPSFSNRTYGEQLSTRSITHIVKRSLDKIESLKNTVVIEVGDYIPSKWPGELPVIHIGFNRRVSIINCKNEYFYEVASLIDGAINT